MAKIKEGDKVRIIMGEKTNLTGQVRVLSDEPGKEIGVELDHYADYAHSLDGLVEEREDAVRGITVGKGWWVRENEIEKL